MSAASWIVAAIVVLLFLFSMFLAVAETAFVRMNRIRALSLADEGSKAARKLTALMERPEQTLNIVLLLVLIAQLASATLIGALLQAAAGVLALVIGIILQIVVFFVIGEVAPKTYAIQHTDRAALRVASFLYLITNFPPLRLISSGLIGLANVILPGKGLEQGPFVTEGEIRALVDEAAEEESIEAEERKLIHSIFQFGDMVVREAMEPRTDMVAIEADETIEAAIERAIEGGFSRMPVFEGTTDTIVGLVYLKDLVGLARSSRGQRPVREVMREANFVPEQKRVAELLREMQSEQFHMAIVVDEYGGTAGLVTLEDLLEEIVGEIADEYDLDEPRVERLSSGALRVPGRTPIHDVSEELGIDLPDTEWDTVGGLVFNLLGHVPEEGEQVEFQGLELCTERVQGRRIISVRISPGLERAPAGE